MHTRDGDIPDNVGMYLVVYLINFWTTSYVPTALSSCQQERGLGSHSHVFQGGITCHSQHKGPLLAGLFYEFPPLLGGFRTNSYFLDLVMVWDESIITLGMSGPIWFDNLSPQDGQFSHRFTKVPVLSAAAASAAVAGVMMARKTVAQKHGNKVVRLAEELPWLDPGIWEGMVRDISFPFLRGKI